MEISFLVYKVPLPSGALLDTGSSYILDTNHRFLTPMSCASLLSLQIELMSKRRHVDSNSLAPKVK